ncbi:uncharacterized protein LOC115921382 [Strongylocentrotus purpuratus]|uniref:DUF7869 domain-containing protein n=1 Tax=Strongylocentrotus purpuratus TaxID=7668 RepID=A0A7M7ND14_STRPU|nr:uncharacterized protein LOC115921382 [Strongylocentrotus purpuratus]
MYCCKYSQEKAKICSLDFTGSQDDLSIDGMDISQLSLDDVSSENHQVGGRKQHGDLFTHHVDEYSFNESDTADHQEFVQPPLFEESDNSDDESEDQLLSSDISGDCQSDFVPSSSTSSKSVIICLNWIEEYCSKRGDCMPHKDEIRLPNGLTKRDIYHQYLTETSDTMEPTIGQSTFYQLWRDFFNHVRISKSGQFSKCQKCVVLRKKMDEAKTKTRKEKIKKAMIEHNNRQMFERQLYYKKRTASKRNKTKYLSVILDGMDQNKTNIPNFTGDKAKGINDLDLLKTHVTGVLLHGQQESLTFVDICEHKHDSNMTINVLLKTLAHVSKGHTKPLPPILFLQADNCWRENKNKYVMALLEMLVGKKIFHEVHLSYLLVGHTHEDIDQLFSQIGPKLKAKSAETIPQLLSLLPNGEVLYGLYDFKSWMTPHISNVTGHTKPHHFRFSMNEKKKVVLAVRGLRNHEWKELPRGFWQYSATGTPVYPRGKPALLQPNFENINLERLVDRVKDWALLFSDEHHEEWWRLYLTELIKVRDDSHKRRQYMNRNITWSLPKLKPYVPDHVVESDEEDTIGPAIAPQLQKKLDEELQVPQVHIAGKRSTSGT